MIHVILILYYSKINLLKSHSFVWKIENGFFCFFNNENIFIIPRWSRFPAKLDCCIFFVQHQIPLFYLNLLLSSNNVLKNRNNLVENQLCNQLLNQLSVVTLSLLSYILKSFLLADLKKTHRPKNFSFLRLHENILCVPF